MQAYEVEAMHLIFWSFVFLVLLSDVPNRYKYRMRTLMSL